MSKSNQEKRHILSIVCAYQTLLNYRMGLYAKRTLGITGAGKKDTISRKEKRDKYVCLIMT